MTKEQSTIRRIESNKRLSAAVVNGGIVYVAGQVPDTLNADVATQTREVLAKIDRLLNEAGSDKSSLLMANVWLVDIKTFDQMNGVWEAWLPAGEAPARATVEARLANPGLRVEIACVAAVRRA
ncbi:MAG TPA: RidA family protein [Casimicrobiaceae bacterium]|nr:RidA family protein [Casimicrobiaceae bacterium]